MAITSPTRTRSPTDTAIDATNEASLRLHRQFGFVQVGHFKQVGYKFNRWLDVTYMERLLE